MNSLIVGFSPMAQTQPASGVRAILVLSVLSFGLLTGAMLLIGISIVGFWKVCRHLNLSPGLHRIPAVSGSS
jgi:hypothetical protein